MVQLPPQSTTHKTLGVMIYAKDVSGKLALPQFQFFATEKGQTDCPFSVAKKLKLRKGKFARNVFCINHYPECLVCRALRRELNH